MRLVIASGKGGTGKTTLAVNLALAREKPTCLLDCDVEAPNVHLFLKAHLEKERPVSIPVPVINEELCDGCGLCSQFCAFNALVSFGTTPILAPELCHGCGGCMRICPQKAISEKPHRIGCIKKYQSKNIHLTQGCLDVGAPLAPPLIHEVKKEATGNFIIIDAPPGTSCPVIATLQEADFVILVTEPTPFGLNDLRLAINVVRDLKLPFGVVINRAVEQDSFIKPFLKKEKIMLLAEIPNDQNIAQAYAQGTPIIHALPKYKSVFTNLLSKVCEEQ